MLRNRLKTRFALALFFAFCLPLAAFAGVMDDAHGTWKLDAGKTAKAADGSKDVPFDTVVINKDRNTLTMRDSQSGQEGMMEFTVQAPSSTGADLQITGGPVLRLKMQGKKEMSLGQADGKNRKEVLYFTAAPAAPVVKHVYLLEVVHGSPTDATDGMLKGKGFKESRKRGSEDPTIYNIVYDGKVDGADATVEVSYYKGVTLGVTVSLPAKTAADKKASEAVYRKVLADWTKAYGESDDPMPTMHVWLLDNDKVRLTLAEPTEGEEDPSYLLAANRPYLD